MEWNRALGVKELKNIPVEQIHKENRYRLNEWQVRKLENSTRTLERSVLYSQTFVTLSYTFSIVSCLVKIYYFYYRYIFLHAYSSYRYLIQSLNVPIGKYHFNVDLFNLISYFFFFLIIFFRSISCRSNRIRTIRGVWRSEC